MATDAKSATANAALAGSTVYLNGQFVPTAKAAIPCLERGYHFGDGVFSAILIRNGVIELYPAHLQHFIDDCKVLNLIPPTIHADAVQELMVRNGVEPKGLYRFKIVASGRHSTSTGAVTYAKSYGLPLSKPATVLMTIRPYAPSDVQIPLEPSIGWKLCVYPEPAMIPFARAKTLAHLGRLMIAQYAADTQSSTSGTAYDDAISVSERGVVLETSFANLFWIDSALANCYYPSSKLLQYHGSAIQTLVSRVFTPATDSANTTAAPAATASATATATATANGAATAAVPSDLKSIRSHAGEYELKDIPSGSFVYRMNSFCLAPVHSINSKAGTVVYARRPELDKSIQTAYEAIVADPNVSWVVKFPISTFNYDSM